MHPHILKLFLEKVKRKGGGVPTTEQIGKMAEGNHVNIFELSTFYILGDDVFWASQPEWPKALNYGSFMILTYLRDTRLEG